MAACAKDSINVWSRTSERIARAMDLLIVFDQQGNFNLATASLDVVNFSLRESMQSDAKATKNAISPFCVNFWRSTSEATPEALGDYKKVVDIVFDKECRKAMANHWIQYRPNFGKKDFNKRSKAQAIIAAVIDLFNATAIVRNKLIDSLEPLVDDLTKHAATLQGLIAPVVSRQPELPKCFEECKGVELGPSEKVYFEKVKKVLKETKRILYMVQMNHTIFFYQEMGIFAQPYEKWIDQIFDLLEKHRHNASNHHVLGTHLLSYQYLKTYLKTYNVFEEVAIIRPEGPYTEVKYSDYFQNRYLKWRITQSMVVVYKKALYYDSYESYLDSAKPYELMVLLMQVFGLIVEEISTFVFSFTVLRDFWASNDKLGFLRGLGECQREVIELYNKISLSFYRRPTINPILKGAEPSILSGGNANEDEKVDRKVFEELLKDTKLTNCSLFKMKLNKADFKEVEKKFKALALKNRTEEKNPFFSEETYPKFWTENPEEGLKNILEHYLVFRNPQ